MQCRYPTSLFRDVHGLFGASGFAKLSQLWSIIIIVLRFFSLIINFNNPRHFHHMKNQNGALHNLAAMPRQEDRASDYISKDILLASSCLYTMLVLLFNWYLGERKSWRNGVDSFSLSSGGRIWVSPSLSRSWRGFRRGTRKTAYTRASRKAYLQTHRGLGGPVEKVRVDVGGDRRNFSLQARWMEGVT